MNAYQVRCERCGRPTSQAYARLHDRQCKRCYTGGDDVARLAPRNPGYASEQTAAFRQTEADLDSCPY